MQIVSFDRGYPQTKAFHCGLKLDLEAECGTESLGSRQEKGWRREGKRKCFAHTFLVLVSQYLDRHYKRRTSILFGTLSSLFCLMSFTWWIFPIHFCLWVIQIGWSPGNKAKKHIVMLISTFVRTCLCVLWIMNHALLSPQILWATGTNWEWPAVCTTWTCS